MDLTAAELRYSWLEPGAIHPILGDIDNLKVLRWDAETFRLETIRSNVVKTVHVQCAIGSEDPVAETRWLEHAASRTGIPSAVIAYTNLKSPDVEAQLERHVGASTRLRGIRDFSDGEYLTDNGFARGCKALEKFRLLLDLDTTWEHMADARDLAGGIPNTPVMLDHVGYPRERSREYFDNWRRGMRSLAEAENAWCKISGLGLCDNQWTVASIRPWVLAAIEIFGVDRCVMGTNWPVDKLYSNYDAVLDAYEEIIAGFTVAEREAIFWRNAERVYQISSRFTNGPPASWLGLEDHDIAVTGAAGGIGREVVHAFASAGARVAAIDVSIDATGGCSRRRCGARAPRHHRSRSLRPGQSRPRPAWRGCRVRATRRPSSSRGCSATPRDDR